MKDPNKSRGSKVGFAGGKHGTEFPPLSSRLKITLKIPSPATKRVGELGIFCLLLLFAPFPFVTPNLCVVHDIHPKRAPRDPIPFFPLTPTNPFSFSTAKNLKTRGGFGPGRCRSVAPAPLYSTMRNDAFSFCPFVRWRRDLCR